MHHGRVPREGSSSAQQGCRHDAVGSTATCCCWLHGVRGYDARIWRICDAAAALLFAADAVVVDAAAAAAASRSDGRLTDEGVLPEFGGELDRFVPAKCVLLGCTECAVRALSEKVRGGCVNSL